MVHLDEAVNQVDGAFGIFYPGDIEFVKLFEVAGLIVFNQQTQGFCLLFVFGKRNSFLQISNDFLQSTAVHRSGSRAPYFFNKAIGRANQFGIQAKHGRFIAIRLKFFLVKSIHLFGGNIFIKIHRRCFNHIHAFFFIGAFGQYFGVKHHRSEFRN